LKSGADYDLAAKDLEITNARVWWWWRLFGHQRSERFGFKRSFKYLNGALFLVDFIKKIIMLIVDKKHNLMQSW